MMPMRRHGWVSFFASVALAALSLSAVAASLDLPGDATDVAMLPGGAQLALGKKALTWRTADGRVQQRLALRAKHLDVRADRSSALAVVLDANAERVQPLRLDLAAGQWRMLPALPDSTGSVAALCLYRDVQQLDHLFVIGADGLAQQWVLNGDVAQLVRRLAVAPDSKGCRVDDASGRLFVSAPDGVWVHRAEAEGKPEREPVLLRHPHGPLQQGSGALAVLPGGVAVVDGKAHRVRWVQRTAQGVWQPLAAHALPKSSQPDALAVWPTEAGLQLALRDDHGNRWSRLPVKPALAKPASAEPSLPVVTARVQTEPVAQYGDAADDPAIWRHPGDATRSRVLATDKKRGLAVYDLQGRERQFLPVGRVNNVDLRQDVLLGGERIDLAAATQRDENSVVLWRVSPEGELSELARLPTGFDDIYGICLHRSATGAAEVFVNDKSGRYLQWRVVRDTPDAPLRAVVLREFRLASQPEGCVADDAAGRVFLGEEKRGIWVLPTVPDGSAPRLVLPVGGLLHADVEGMGLYRGARQSWLVVSSQGNHSYVVLDAAPPFTVRGAFRIGMNLAAGIDGTSETDGLEVNSASFGPGFEQGLLVVQDGHKHLLSGPQNFKYVAWSDVAKALRLP